MFLLIYFDSVVKYKKPDGQEIVNRNKTKDLFLLHNTRAPTQQPLNYYMLEDMIRSLLAVRVDTCEPSPILKRAKGTLAAHPYL